MTLIEPGFVDTELQSHNPGEVLETLEAMREHLGDPLRAQDIANGDPLRGLRSRRTCRSTRS